MRIEILILVMFLFVMPFGNILSQGFTKQFEDTTKEVIDGKKQIYYQVHYLNDSLYKVIWGKGDKTFHTKKNFMWTPYTYSCEKYSSEYLVLHQGCGTSCYTLLFLPLNGSEEKEFFYCLAYNLERGLVAYISEEDFETIIIENIKNGKKYYLKIADMCNASSKYTCLEKADFNNNTLTIYYSGKNWKPDAPDIHKIKIECDLN